MKIERKYLFVLIPLVVIGVLFLAVKYFNFWGEAGPVVELKVDLSGQNLDSVPKKVLTNSKITILDLSNNNLTSLPSEIGNLENLQELYLNNNKLTGSLPAEIRKMTNLRILNASSNEMTGIPAEIGQLKKIETLDYGLNKINTYPNELINLVSLKILNLSGNLFDKKVLQNLQSRMPSTQVLY